MSIRVRILIFVAVVILALLGFLSFFGVSATRDSTQQTLAERLVLAEQVAYKADSDLEQTIRQLRTMSQEQYKKISQGDVESSFEFLHETRQILPYTVHYILLINELGSIFSSEPSGMESVNIHSLPEFSSLISPQPGVSSVIRDEFLNTYVVYIATPVSGLQSSPSVWVVAALDLSSTAFQSLTNVSGVGKTGYVEIVDGSGIVLATGKTQNFLIESDHGGVFADLIRNRKTAVSACHSCHDAPEKDLQRDIITFAPLSKAPWGVVVRQPEAEALATTHMLQTRLYIFGLVALIFILPTVWYASRAITTPIKRLTLASARIARGSLDEKVEKVTTNGKDEISVLARSFEVMRTKLKDSLDKTTQRTKELEELNAIALTVSQSLDLDTILHGALERITTLVNMELGGIVLISGNTITYKVNRGFSERFIEENCKSEMSAEHKVAATGQPIFVEDVREIDTPTNELLRQEDIKAFVCLPLRSKDRFIGVLSLASRTPRDFLESDHRLLSSIASQISIAIENAELYDEVRNKEAILTELLKNSITAQEEERKRIARELHDETSQALTTLSIGLETISKSPPTDVTNLQTSLKNIQQLTLKTLDDIHRLILDLRPSILDDLGLIPAVEWYAKNRLEPKGVKVHLEMPSIEFRAPPHIEVALFRIAQEAISNIAQYSQAEYANISLDFENDKVSLEVEDDGVGFNPEEVLSKLDGKRGLGMLGMKERVEVLGGSFSVQSEPGMGTQLFISIPLYWSAKRDGQK